jgi:hypothetical protein
MVEFVINSFHHLAYPRQPAAEPLRPRLRAVAFGRADHPRAVLLVPGRMFGHSRKALVHHIGALGWRPRSTPLRLRGAAEGEQRVSQELILRTCRAKAKARDAAHGGDGEEQGKALIPAQPIAPADIRQPRQPAQPTALGIAGRDAGTVQGFVQTLLCGQELH